MRTPLSACCKTSRSSTCALVDTCIKDIVSVLWIAELMESICAQISGSGVGLDRPGFLEDALFRVNLLEKHWGARGGISELYKLKGSGFVSRFAFEICALRLLRLAMQSNRSNTSTMAPPTTPVIMATRGNFLEPRVVDVEWEGLLDGTLEDVAEVALETLVRVEVVDAFWTRLADAFWTTKLSSARGAVPELPWYVTMSSCCPGDSVSVLKNTWL